MNWNCCRNLAFGTRLANSFSGRSSGLSGSVSVIGNPVVALVETIKCPATTGLLPIELQRLIIHEGSCREMVPMSYL
jgi:hypothetical protein